MPERILESRCHKALIVCPKCGSEESETVWDSINVRSDPDLKEILLSKRLQNHVCANCNLDIVMAEPLLYHDPDGKRLYCVLPEAMTSGSGTLPDRDQLDALARSLCGITLRETSDYTLRVVDSYNQLIEKIHLDDHGRNDRLMELIKIAARKSGMTHQPDAGIAQLYYLTEKDGIMTFLAQGQDEKWVQMDLVTEAYENAEALLGQTIRESGTWERIDATYAVELINRLSGS